MSAALPLRAALTRGAMVVLANWPVVLAEFAIESLYKLALAVPVVGGAFMVAVLVGADVRALLGEGVRSGAELILGALINAPRALVSFVVAGLLVAVGGSLVMFLIKAGTLSIVIEGERVARDLERGPVHWDALVQANTYDIPRLIDGIRRFGRRAMVLSLWLSLAYGLLAFAYFETLGATSRLAEQPQLGTIWPLVVVLATSVGVVAVTVVNLIYDLVRIIVIADDCSVRAALGRLWAFLIADTRQVIGILAVVGTLLLLAAAVSILIAAGLALITWIPFIGLIVVPLQVAAWLVRGLLFQYMGLTALAAYFTQYRRFAGARA